MSRRSRGLPPGPHEVRVAGVTHAGQGVARVEGKAVFVPGALPGELVRLTVVDDRARFARGRLDAVLEPGDGRTEPPCPYAQDCGGCDLQHATPAAQRALKTRIVREQLERLGGIEDPPVEDCVAVSPAAGYRNQAVLHAGPDGRLGFHRAGTHEVVAVDRCLVLSAAAQAVRDAVGDDTGAAQLTIRAHGETGRSAAVLTPGPGPLELPEAPADLLLAQPDGSLLTLRGSDTLEAAVAGHAYHFDPTSFFQANTAGAESLITTVLEAAGEIAGLAVWDLYAGVGLLSLPLAAAGAEVVAVEGHGPAAAHARANAERAGLDLHVLAEPVERMVRRAAADLTGATGAARGSSDGSAGTHHLDPPDVVVLDPPRTGAGPRVIESLIALAVPSIVLVACDVGALARDTRHLHTGGYVLESARPLDLFPMTHHVEVVASYRPSTG